QHTALALSRVLPGHIPTSYLFRYVRITRSNQPFQLYKVLRSGGVTISWVQSLAMECWEAVDANIVLMVLQLLPDLPALTIYIGPASLAPEHLDELLTIPRPNLRYLSLRFKPYVDKPSYDQFLRGAYFDSALTALAKWPACDLPSLSIVQDPMDPKAVHQRAFAQPLVFLGLDVNLSVLASSDYLSTVTALRLRIPGRQVTQPLTAHPWSLPSIDLLDLSTCNILESDVDALLQHFVTLRYLILDECAVFHGELRGGEWEALGKRCALAGVRRAAERELTLRIWLEANSTAHRDAALKRANQKFSRKIKRGRHGLASSYVSIRQEIETTLPVGPAEWLSSGKRLRVLPPWPTLRSITISSCRVRPDTVPAVRAEFEAGWTEGLAQLEVRRATLRKWRAAGTSIILCFKDADDAATDSEDDDDGENYEDGLQGLAFISSQDDFALRHVPCPVLCLAGADRHGNHVEGCGHEIAWDIWKDGL
ncbi:hypothetical protein FISHEDRAFT_47461, partial [Fistulina hepatica ATCC 64428]